MQAPDSINLEYLSELSSLTNSTMGPASGPKGTGKGGATTTTAGGETKSIEEVSSVAIGGEQGTGGRPLIKKPENPYLEIDLIDTQDPVLFEGEV